MSRPILRVGLLGTGLMAQEHLRNLALQQDAEVVALSDPTPSSLEWAKNTLGSKATGVQTYADGPSMLAGSKPDAVIVSSPNYTHHDVLIPLIEAGVHILCEKPLCTTLDDAKATVDRTSKHDGVFWVGMEYRYMPPVSAFIDRISNGDIGRLVMLAIREHRFPFLPKVGDWNRFSANTGGTMVEKCCHFFDLMRVITASEPVRVFCSGAMDVNHQDERYNGAKPDIIDNAYSVVDFANGTRAHLDLCMFAEGAHNQEEIVAVGDKAKLEVLIPDGDLIHSPRVPWGAEKPITRTHVETPAEALAAGHHHGATYFQQEAFLRAVRGEGPVVVTAEDGLRAVAMGLAAEISAREHRVVSLAELGL